MTKPVLQERLQHILEVINEIEKHTSDLTLEEFKSNRFLQLGVERCLEIISEATRHVPDEAKAQFLHIPWRQIADMGNRIRHAYHAVDSEIIWEIVTGELKTLQAAILEISQSDSQSPKL